MYVEYTPHFSVNASTQLRGQRSADDSALNSILIRCYIGNFIHCEG